MLPKIRSNQVDEAELSLLIGDYNNSPFEREKFLTVLNARQKEIETAEFIIYHEDLKTISNKYVDLDNSGDMAECVIGNDYSVVYELQILPKGRFIIDNDFLWDFQLSVAYLGPLITPSSHIE